MDPTPGWPTKCRVRPLASRYPALQLRKRPNARLPSFAASSNSSSSSLLSMSGSAVLDRLSNSRSHRKKNDGGGLRKSLEPVRTAVAKNLCRSAQEWPTGSEGGGDGDSLHRTPDGRGRGDRTAAPFHHRMRTTTALPVPAVMRRNTKRCVRGRSSRPWVGHRSIVLTIYVPRARFSLNFGKLEITYTEQKRDGSAAGEVRGAWDLAANKAL